MIVSDWLYSGVGGAACRRPEVSERGGWGGSVGGWGDELVGGFQAAAVFNVIGADVALRYPSEMNGPTIVVRRSGFGELSDENACRTDGSNEGSGRSDLFLCEHLYAGDISSTKLRMALHEGS